MGRKTSIVTEQRIPNCLRLGKYEIYVVVSMELFQQLLWKTVMNCGQDSEAIKQVCPSTHGMAIK